MNDASSHPEYFEELCALAASSQISELELVELSDHMRNCVRCQAAYGDFVDLVHNKLPLADPALAGSFKLGRTSSKESSYRERFVTRARKEGLAVSSEVLSGTPESRFRSFWLPRLNFAQFAPLAMALLLVTAGILGYAWRQSNARYVTLAAQLAEINGQIRPQERPEPGPSQVPGPENRSEPRSLPPHAVPEQAVALPTNTNDGELDRVRQDYADALASAKAADERLQKVSGDLETVAAQLTRSRNRETQLQNSLNDAREATEQAVGDLHNVSEKLRASESSRKEEQPRQTQESKVKLTASIEPKDKGNGLFTDWQKIHDQLLDLRIIDMREFDSRGKESRATAKVFYKSGKSKSLLFVASGLNGKKGAKGNALQLWGAHGISATSVRSLGIVDIDDLETDLWALTVTDSSKLEGVDTIYLTVEKAGGSEKPTSKQLMYTYLPQIPTKQ
jgi:hypothetical protein